MTVGDVNAVAWLVGGTGVTLWTSVVGTAVIFKSKAKRAATAVEEETRKVAGVGAVLVVTAGLFALILINQPNGLLKLIGWALLACLMLLAILGSAGLATFMGERLCLLDNRLSLFSGIARGAGILVAAGFLPFVGWFLLFPAMLALSLGTGWRAITAKPSLEQAADPTIPAISA